MNQRNFQYNAETLAGIGFGDFFNDQLRTKMNLGFQKIELLGDKMQNDGSYIRFAPQLNLSKNEEFSDFYFLNTIRATHKDANGISIAAAEFKIIKKSGFSVEEMENMLIHGRAVYREFRNDEGDKQAKYYRLDLDNKDENGIVPIISYAGKMSIERELDKLNIQWSNKREKEEAINDLKSGARVSVMVKEGREVMRASLESAPHKGGLAVINGEGAVIKYTNSQAQAMQVVAETGLSNNQAMQIGKEGSQLQATNDKPENKAKEVLAAMENTKVSQTNRNRIK